jgi:hypothetical protein
MSRPERSLAQAARSQKPVATRGRGDALAFVDQPATAIQAALALITVSQRLGYSVDPDARPGFTVLADSVHAGSYGQLFPVSLTATSGGTRVQVGISAKDPACALTEAVQERRLEDLVRRMRAIFVAAEDDTGADSQIRG